MQKPTPYCIHKRDCEIVCCTSKCTKNCFMCNHKGCQCKKLHAQCNEKIFWQQLNTKIFEKTVRKEPQLTEYNNKIDAIFRNTIKQMQIYEQNFQTRFKKFGMTKQEQELEKLFEAKNYKEMNGNMINQIKILFEKKKMCLKQNRQKYQKNLQSLTTQESQKQKSKFIKKQIYISPRKYQQQVSQKKDQVKNTPQIPSTQINLQKYIQQKFNHFYKLILLLFLFMLFIILFQFFTFNSNIRYIVQYQNILKINQQLKDAIAQKNKQLQHLKVLHSQYQENQIYKLQHLIDAQNFVCDQNIWIYAGTIEDIVYILKKFSVKKFEYITINGQYNSMNYKRNCKQILSLNKNYNYQNLQWLFSKKSNLNNIIDIDHQNQKKTNDKIKIYVKGF